MAKQLNAILSSAIQFDMANLINNFDLFIDGSWAQSEVSDRIERTHPGSGELVSTYARGTKGDVEKAVSAANKAFQGPWRTLTAQQRSDLLFEGAGALFAQREKLAGIESTETGKPFKHALDDICNGIQLWKYAASSLRTLHGEIYPSLDPNFLGMTFFEPVGIVGLITPWNFPFIVAAERLPFILAAGCTIVCKPSEYASGTSLFTAEILSEAGFPPGVVNVVTGFAENVGIPLVEHPKVAMISFTGSSENGRRVMETASKTLKRLSLELGGKSPILVFADANLDAAADGVIAGFTHNAGQCCIATTRLLVERSIASRFETILTQKLRSNFGEGKPQPVATLPQFNKVANSIKDGNNTGRCLFGEQPGNPADGLFVQPHVFADLPPDSPLVRNEIFGPVLTVNVFDTENEAIQLANDTIYGLAATIWSEDQCKAVRVTKAIRAGRIWLNSQQVNFPELPVGGFGASGIGREAGSTGIRTYSEIKTIIMAQNGTKPSNLI
ncbi:MAG: aldehyde dehydrogenase family protein [Candidatus Riflebacteria bacterium]|nr:aldehyde dehydrogenase family protein [Candidatus Riflebacteria bacterium]